MTSTQIRTVPTSTERAPRPRRRRPTRTGILFTAAAAIFVAATVVGLAWNLDAEPAAPPTTSLSTPSAPPPAYQPGGSVYEQQVPDFQHWALVYGPGGSLYKSQVPHGR